MPRHSSRVHEATLPRPRIEDRIADEARFIWTWLDKPALTGAVSPSGRFLARMMARAVDPAGTAPIVELGPGTGPITQALLDRGVDPRRLVLVEYDAAFCRLLRKRFPQTQVVQGDAYALSATLADRLSAPAAAVVSSLPLLNRPDAERTALLDDAFSLMAPSGSFVQFTYGMVSPVPHAARAGYAADVSPAIWFNLPPARVWVYRRQGAEAPAAQGARPAGRSSASSPFRPARLEPVRLFRRRPPRTARD